MTALGLSLTDETNGATIDELVERCRAEGVDFVELPAGPLERAIGAPVPTVALEPPPENGIELGLLELEEEVLQDSYELARATFDAQLREWRRATSLAPAGAIRRSWEAAGRPIRFVAWAGLDRLSDIEVDYACRFAAALGAGAIVSDLPSAAAVRLASMRCRVPIAVRNAPTLGPLDLDLLLTRGPALAAALDLTTWLDGRHGDPLPFIEEHAGSIAQLRLAARGIAAAPFGEHTVAVGACLAGLRTAGLDLPVVVEADSALRAAALAWLRG